MFKKIFLLLLLVGGHLQAESNNIDMSKYHTTTPPAQKPQKLIPVYESVFIKLDLCIELNAQEKMVANTLGIQWKEIYRDCLKHQREIEESISKIKDSIYALESISNILSMGETSDRFSNKLNRWLYRNFGILNLNEYNRKFNFQDEKTTQMIIKELDFSDDEETARGISVVGVKPKIQRAKLGVYYEFILYRLELDIKQVKAQGATQQQIHDILNRVTPYFDGLEYLKQEFRKNATFNYNEWFEMTWCRENCKKREQELTIIP